MGLLTLAFKIVLGMASEELTQICTDGIYTDILINASEVFLFDPGGGITHKCQCTEPRRISSENC
jgi:hypothetical protein